MDGVDNDPEGMPLTLTVVVTSAASGYALTLEFGCLQPQEAPLPTTQATSNPRPLSRSLHSESARAACSLWVSA